MLVFFHSERNMLYKCASEMEKTMYQLNEKQPVRVEEATFSDIGWKESDIEDLLRKNVDMICDDEESMLIVGQQVHNAGNGRSDLIAMDNNGNIVLIEIKRDKRDIEGRKEAFEFQAIRYAATCATIKSSDELIQNIFAPYVEKHKDEFDNGPGLTSSEIAQRQFNDFIDRNGIKNFNENQRIILVAGDFDGQTLSAVAWLNSYHVDISCYQLHLLKTGDTVFLQPNKVLPVTDYEDYYVEMGYKGSVNKGDRRDISRRSLPKIDKLMEWGIVQAGDILVARGTQEKAVLQENGQVKLNDDTVLSLQQWLKQVFGWSSVETYAFAVDAKTGKTLSELRQEYMESLTNEQ